MLDAATTTQLKGYLEMLQMPIDARRVLRRQREVR